MRQLMALFQWDGHLIDPAMIKSSGRCRYFAKFYRYWKNLVSSFSGGLSFDTKY
jgi:hypothetical protein